MRYRIDRDNPVPAYLQLYRQLREDIVGGVYPYHAKLPSKRIVAGELGLSTVTVEHSYALLCDEGYVQPRERSGYYVIFRPESFPRFGTAASQTAAPSQAVPSPAAPSQAVSSPTALSPAALSPTALSPAAPSLASLSPAAPSPAVLAPETDSGGAREKPSAAGFPHFPFSVLARAMRKVISERGESILERSPNMGCVELRGAISRYLARSRGIAADIDQIVIGSGSEYLYGLIVELLGRGRVYGIESPSYKKIEQVYHACDVRIEKLPLGRDGLESSALWAACAGVLHISPYRSFPSGVTASASKRHEYIRWASTDGRYLVEDDFESEFSVLTKPEETLFALSADDNVIYMNTFSQTISPSLRVGYMVLPRRLAPEFVKKLGFYACTVPTYLQYVLTELIDSGDFERHINRVRRKKREAIDAKS